MAKGGLAGWSIRHPISTIMVALSVVMVGLFVLGRLPVSLLPHFIYPQIRVRVVDPGVAPAVMEDRVTRLLEARLAITKGATDVESTTREGSTTVDLSFPYGTDMDAALRDASERLDRAREFLPSTIEPPTVEKHDPSQIPVCEYVISSAHRDPTSLRTWADNVFANWFANLPGVARVQVSGGLKREIDVVPDPRRLAALGLNFDDVIRTVREGDANASVARFAPSLPAYGGRVIGRLTSLAALAALPLRLAGGDTVQLSDVARVADTHADEHLRVRDNGVAGVRVSVRKEPDANTVDIAEAVTSRLAWLKANSLIPADLQVNTVSDQSVYVEDALRNATYAAMSGALLAMIVVYLFLGSVRRTLIIGTAIPIAMTATFVLMSLRGLTLNMMTLGGLALGVGMLVDSTIVMLENISRHQRRGLSPVETGVHAAAEVNGAIVASTTTSLAAIVPFLFVGGLVGVVFRGLIFTISAALVVSMVVALTLVPTLGARIQSQGNRQVRARVDTVMKRLRGAYGKIVAGVLDAPGRVIAVGILLLIASAPYFFSSHQIFLPKLDDGQVRVRVTAKPDTSMDAMDHEVGVLEALIHHQGNVENVFTMVGGSLFEQASRSAGDLSTLEVRLVPREERRVSVAEWVSALRKTLDATPLPGIRVQVQAAGLRRLRFGHSDDAIRVRLQGPDLATLAALAHRVEVRLKGISGLENLGDSAERTRRELTVAVDRKRVAELGLDVSAVGRALRVALSGIAVGDLMEGANAFPIRVRLSRAAQDDPQAVGSILLFGADKQHPAVRVRNVAQVKLVQVPVEIKRDNQRRIVEVTGTVGGHYTLGEVTAAVRARLQGFTLPPGYTLYYRGAGQSLANGKHVIGLLLVLALFLVFAVMAAQYESLRNPLVILLCVPFAAAGAAAGLWATGLSPSMPVWLGLVMLAGIVVNNSIVLVEYIEIARAEGADLRDAIVKAARLRLRPILMTTLTTVVGMLPLAVGWGAGTEILRPLAVTLVAGLSFAALVSLLLVPAVYFLAHRKPRASLLAHS